MSFDLGKLFIEWRRIVPNGVPNPGNAYHLVLLKEICLAKGMDREVVDNVILTLEQDDEKIQWKDKDGKDVIGNIIKSDLWPSILSFFKFVK